MSSLHICWSHGQESGPYGAKMSALSEVARHHSLQMIALDYRGMSDPRERVDRLVAHCRAIDAPIVLVGSSMGGYVSVATAAEIPVRGLFLLAPALYLPGLPSRDLVVSCEVITIVHGWRDAVIPPENSVQFAKKHRASLHLIDGDHRLKTNIPELKNYFSDFLKSVAALGQGLKDV